MRILYSVFPHKSFNGVKYGVQLPKGVLGFQTKKAAERVAEELRRAFAPQVECVNMLVTGDAPKRQMTEDIARRAATDAANRSMRAAGRTRWGREDYDVACRELNRLWPEAPVRFAELDSYISNLEDKCNRA